SLDEPAAAALGEARRRVAAVLGRRRSGLTFRARGTAAAQLASTGLAVAAPPRRHPVTYPTELQAVLASIEHLRQAHGFDVSFVEVGAEGQVTARALRAVLREDTTLVSLAHADNEIGAVTDVRALAEATHEVGALLHTDAVQSAGWLDLR